jgi:hypothetical protein
MLRAIVESGESHRVIDLVKGSGHGRSWVISPAKLDSGVYVVVGAENPGEAVLHWILSGIASDPLFRWETSHRGLGGMAREGEPDLEFEVRSVEALRELQVFRGKEQEPSG